MQVEKIAKAKYQDNLELIQWLKRYYDVNCGGRGENYPAEERRGFVVPDFSFSDKTVTPKTYNGSGETTYSNNNALKLPKKEPSKGVSSGYGALSSHSNQANQNFNQANYAPKPAGKSVSDQKLGSIREILAQDISNDDKVAQIELLLDE